MRNMTIKVWKWLSIGAIIVVICLLAVIVFLIQFSNNRQRDLSLTNDKLVALQTSYSNLQTATNNLTREISNKQLRNFNNLEELTEWLKQDKTETENYDDFKPYALELQQHAFADGYIMNINYQSVDLSSGNQYVLVTDSAIADDMLYSILPCNLMTDVDPDLKADRCMPITPIIAK